jgi:hypothetical protein
VSTIRRTAVAGSVALAVAAPAVGMAAVATAAPAHHIHAAALHAAAKSKSYTVKGGTAVFTADTSSFAAYEAAGVTPGVASPGKATSTGFSFTIKKNSGTITLKSGKATKGTFESLGGTTYTGTNGVKITSSNLITNLKTDTISAVASENGTSVGRSTLLTLKAVKPKVKSTSLTFKKVKVSLTKAAAQLLDSALGTGTTFQTHLTQGYITSTIKVKKK